VAVEWLFWWRGIWASRSQWLGALRLSTSCVDRHWPRGDADLGDLLLFKQSWRTHQQVRGAMTIFAWFAQKFPLIQ